MRVLDEVAEAIRRAGGGSSVPVLSAFGLEEVFGGVLNPPRWAVIQRCLGGWLPPLRFDQGHWLLPDGLTTVWDLVDRAARANPDWERPRERTEAAWRNAQIFVGVRCALVDALAVDPEHVTRETVLVDLI